MWWFPLTIALAVTTSDPQPLNVQPAMSIVGKVYVTSETWAGCRAAQVSTTVAPPLIVIDRGTCTPGPQPTE